MLSKTPPDLTMSVKGETRIFDRATRCFAALYQHRVESHLALGARIEPRYDNYPTTGQDRDQGTPEDLSTSAVTRGEHSRQPRARRRNKFSGIYTQKSEIKMALLPRLKRNECVVLMAKRRVRGVDCNRRKDGRVFQIPPTLVTLVLRCQGTRGRRTV